MSSNCCSSPSSVRNNMAFDLGFQVGYPAGSEDWTYNSIATNKWLTELDKKMDLVMVTEYMDESLILLRRLMCWSVKDIIYETRNVNYHKKEKVSENLVKVYRKWSAVDAKLYDHFLKKFQVMLSQQDESFWQELAHFKLVNQEVLSFCKTVRASKNETSVFKYFVDAYGVEFKMTSADCKMVGKILHKEILDFYNMVASTK